MYVCIYIYIYIYIHIYIIWKINIIKITKKDSKKKKVQERHQNLPEKQKQELLKYMRIYYLVHKK